ncbi:MAG: hypothetical protein QNJ67_13620 [Kiloniellales bacterium]|nr:hypothetical protein [Kiloniellales bacterium]
MAVLALLANLFGFLARVAAWAMIVAGFICAVFQVFTPIAVALFLAGLVALPIGKLLGRAGRTLSARRRDRIEALDELPEAEIYDFAAASARKQGEA